jgi:hypothetical protein
MSHMEDLRKRSGEISSADPLVGFLYDLIRGHLPAGVVEKLVMDNTTGEEMLFTNGWLANYAKDLAERLKNK